MWEDITDILTPRGIDLLQVKQIMRFDYEGSSVELKIMRKSKRKDGSVHVFAKRVTTHDPNTTYVTETGEDGHQETMSIGELL